MFKIIKYLVLCVALTSFKSISQEETPPKFIGISNLLYDTIVRNDDKNSLELTIRNIIPDMTADSTTWISADQSQLLQEALQNYREDYIGPGGSAANTIAGLKFLGEEAGVIGALAEDEIGKLYKSSLERKNIQYRITVVQDHALGSGNCTVLIKDNIRNERTMLTNLGVSGDINLSTEDLNWIAQAECLIIEGYLFQPLSTYNSICLAAKQMKDHQKKVVLTLSAEFCVKNNLDNIKSYIDAYVDIIIGNDQEMQLLTNEEKALDSACLFQRKGLTGAVTCGCTGAYLFNPDQVIFIPPPAVDEVLDTTGAGDQFLAGFLHGLFSGQSLNDSGLKGAHHAGQIIRSWGGQP